MFSCILYVVDEVVVYIYIWEYLNGFVYLFCEN